MSYEYACFLYHSMPHKCIHLDAQIFASSTNLHHKVFHGHHHDLHELPIDLHVARHLACIFKGASLWISCKKSEVLVLVKAIPLSPMLPPFSWATRRAMPRNDMLHHGLLQQPIIACRVDADKHTPPTCSLPKCKSHWESSFLPRQILKFLVAILMRQTPLASSLMHLHLATSCNSSCCKLPLKLHVCGFIISLNANAYDNECAEFFFLLNQNAKT